MIERSCIKHRKGFGLFELLLIVLILGAAFFFFIIPIANTQAINTMKSMEPPVTAQGKQLIDSFKSKPTPETSLHGYFYGEGEFDSKSYSITYFFAEDKTVTKEVTILGKYNLSGSAKYYFDGSVMKFTEIVGDKYLFPQMGEAVSIPNEDIIVYHYGRLPLTLKSATLIEQETIRANKVAAQRKEMLASKSIFDLSINEALEKAMLSTYFTSTIFLLTVLLAVVLFRAILQRAAAH